VSWLIRRSSAGPVFYTQERMGLDGKAFTVYKFRSMPVDAEDVTGPIWARDDDPRATRIGKWLRRHDLDELPQFWNVLRGDMSIVGPRPVTLYEAELYPADYEQRFAVKPGITGLWQVSGRSNVSEDERIRLDHSYVDNWSCVQDLVIVWRTIRAVFVREGAY